MTTKAKLPVTVATWLAASAAVAGLSACILFVDPASDLGGTCHIRGETTTCGACLMARCRAQLDACCGDATCAAILDTVDSCVADYTQAVCTLLSTKSPVVTTPLDRLTSCTADCASTCSAAAGPPGSSGGSSGISSSGGTSLTNCSAFVSSECDCYGDLGPNDVACSTDSIGAGVCCADYGWPNKGLSCSCKAYRCKQTSDGCICSDTTSGPSSTCSGDYCCLFEDTCTCGTTPCDSVSKPVASCTKATATCPGDTRHVVPSCSLKTGDLLPDSGRD